MSLGLADRERAATLVRRHFGLSFLRDPELLERGVERAARAEKLTPAELLTRLEAAGEEGQEPLLRHLINGETYLFRHPEHFTAVRELIAPTLGPRPRVWSAGCSTGEEAYSLAVALPSAQVLGTDICRSSLATAARGRWGRWSKRAHAPLGGELAPTDDGGMRAKPRLRQRVRFEYFNLVGDAPLAAPFDLVFCRNVLVYLAPEAAQRAMAQLVSRLEAGGWLVVSAIDVDLAPPHLERVRHDGLVILRQPARSSARSREVKTSRAEVAASGPLSSLPPAVAPDLLLHAKAAADRGDLGQAQSLLRTLLARDRRPTALHLLALVLPAGTREARELLVEAIHQSPDYALAHLSLGLGEAADGETRATHLRRVLELVAGRRDEDLLDGPEPIPVAWARKLALAGLREGGRER
jgi:chemotaxis protein methyltransferase CheR